MSRPFINKDNPRDKMVRVMLSLKEFQFIVDCASYEGVSVSQFIRNSMGEYIIKKGYKPKKDLKSYPIVSDLPDLY